MISVLTTAGHLVSGQLRLRGVRLSDAMNKDLESVIRLVDAEVAAEPGAPAERLEVAMIPKRQVVLAYEAGERIPARDKRLFAYVAKRPNSVFLVADGHVVRGDLHSRDQLDPANLHRIVAETGDEFLPVTDATVALRGGADGHLEVGAVMVNVRHIEVIARSQPAEEPAQAESA